MENMYNIQRRNDLPFSPDIAVIIAQIRRYWQDRNTREWFVFGKQPMAVRRVSSQIVMISTAYIAEHSDEDIHREIEWALEWHQAGYADFTEEIEEILPKIQSKKFDYNIYASSGRGLRDRTKIVVTVKQKRCIRCRHRRKAKYFSRNKQYPDGLNRECKLCMRERYNERHGGNVVQREFHVT